MSAGRKLFLPGGSLNWTVYTSKVQEHLKLTGLAHLKVMGKLKRSFLPAQQWQFTSPGAVMLGSAPPQPTVCLSYVPSFTWDICSLHKSLSFKDSPLLGKTEFSLRLLSSSLALTIHRLKGGFFPFVSKQNLFYCFTWSKQKSWTGFIHIFITQDTCSVLGIIKALSSIICMSHLSYARNILWPKWCY